MGHFNGNFLAVVFVGVAQGDQPANVFLAERIGWSQGAVFKEVITAFGVDLADMGVAPVVGVFSV